MPVEAIKGLSFPIRFNSSLGHLERAIGADKITSNLKSIVYTSKGERPMNWRFGTLGYDALFRNLDPTSLAILDDIVKRAIAEAESRVVVHSITPFVEELDGKLRLTVRFRITQTGEFYDTYMLLRS